LRPRRSKTISKYKVIRVQIKNHDVLIAALKACEIPYEEGEQLPLYGYRGDCRKETADIVVRRAHIGSVANDLGFALNEAEGRYDVIISEFDEHDAPGHGLHVLNRVKQQYAVQKVTALAEERGYVIQPEEAENGVVRLRLVHYG
jgi:hypothetical protein